MRPRLLLVPAFTELQWTIKPLLEEWADVVSYDPPGVGSEPALEPLAARVSCPEACSVSPAFAEALREFCSGLLVYSATPSSGLC